MHVEQKRNDYSKALKDALDAIVSKLSAIPEVERLILFGSYVNERSDLFTDIDLVVVINTEKDFITRTTEIYREVEAGVDLDLLVYTPDEFERLKHKSFLKRALSNSRLLYEKKSH